MCSFDYIQIFQEDSKHRLLSESRLCGRLSDHQINVSNNTNVVSVHFRSDSSTEKEGFVLNYSLANGMCALHEPHTVTHSHSFYKL